MTNDAVTIDAPAKINLFLHIAGKRGDGYHQLQSLIGFADVGEHLVLSRAEEDSLTLIDADPQLSAEPVTKNLVWQAVTGFRDRFDCAPADIELTKRIPVGGGLGGGSADAAAVLRALAKQHNVPLDDPALLDLALSLGADVPACLREVPQLVSGIGERITLLGHPLPPAWLVLANPGVHQPTPQVFKALDLSRCHGAIDLPTYPFANVAELAEWLGANTHNDMTEAACSQASPILRLLDSMSKLPSQRLVRMSGSGASCFAVFDTQQSAKRAAALLHHTGHAEWIAVAPLITGDNR